MSDRDSKVPWGGKVPWSGKVPWDGKVPWGGKVPWDGKVPWGGKVLWNVIQGGSNMTGTDLCVNKPHCAAALRP